MSTLKRAAIRSLFFGFGSIVAIGLIGAVYYWYSSLPVPWKTDEIIAEFNGIDTEGEKNTLVFHYVLANHSENDYNISEYSDTAIYATLSENQELSGNEDSEVIKFEKPLFLPTGHKSRFSIRLRYPTSFRSPKNATKNEIKEFRENLKTYVANELSNLDGFILFDKTKRFKVIFKSSWKNT